MIRIEKYKKENREDWDSFVQSSKNGTFLIKRDFLEYHAHRFTDASLLIYRENKLIALFPANIADNIVYSHQGLTYGGLIMGIKTTTVIVLDIFQTLLQYWKKGGIKKVIYKTIPYIYHNQPSDEDRYALFRIGAELLKREISSSVYMQNRIKYSELRRRSIKKAQNNNLKVKEETADFSRFWDVLHLNLKDRHQANPVHSIEEITDLKSKFPKEIRLFCSYNDENDILGGMLVFEMKNIVHVQYISSSPVGRTMGAIDIVLDYLYQVVYKDMTYFDFGVSTEDGGRFLNEGLIGQKEGFGGRGVVYDTYQIDIK